MNSLSHKMAKGLPENHIFPVPHEKPIPSSTELASSCVTLAGKPSNLLGMTVGLTFGVLNTHFKERLWRSSN